MKSNNIKIVALMYTVTPTTSPSYIYGASVLLGLGAGSATSKGYSVAPALLLSPSKKSPVKRSPEPQYIPASIAFLNIAQIGSVVHALAISGSVFQNVAFRNLKNVFTDAGLKFTDEEIRGAVAGAKSLVFQELKPDVKKQAVNAIVDSIGSVYALALAAGALLVVASLGLRWERLFQKPTTEAPKVEAPNKDTPVVEEGKETNV
jgi:hypothetical protein